jgi:hypothetical protein
MRSIVAVNPFRCRLWAFHDRLEEHVNAETCRLFVARHLNAQLLVEMRPMSDLEAIVAIDIENRQRVDVSPYERGLSFAQWLRAGTSTRKMTSHARCRSLRRKFRVYCDWRACRV